MALLERADMGAEGLADAEGEPKPNAPPPRSPEDGVTLPLSMGEGDMAAEAPLPPPPPPPFALPGEQK